MENKKTMLYTFQTKSNTALQYNPYTQSIINSMLICVHNHDGCCSTTEYEHSSQQQSKPTIGLCPMLALTL